MSKQKKQVKVIGRITQRSDERFYAELQVSGIAVLSTTAALTVSDRRLARIANEWVQTHGLAEKHIASIVADLRLLRNELVLERDVRRSTARSARLRRAAVLDEAPV